MNAEMYRMGVREAFIFSGSSVTDAQDRTEGDNDD